MAEPLVNGLDPRKKLYSALVGSSDKELAGQVKQFSYNKFNGLLDNNDFVRDLFMDISERGIVLDPKNPNASKDPVEFANAFIYREPVAKPQPKVQAAPAMQMAAPMEEEEAYTPPPQPLVGTPEYDAQLQAQYGGMTPTLGATFGGVPASFETKAQKKQEQISPAFKAQQLAFEDVPIAEEQRKAQRQFAKAEKQQQQAALRGGTGFEYQQEQKNKERGYGAAKAEDLLGSITSGGERIAKNVLSGIAWLNQASMAADPNMPLEYEQRQQQIKDASQRMYDASASSQNQFQEELAKRNIQTSILDAIDKGNYGRIPEATLYTIGDAAMQIIPSILTMGGSTYFQTLPEAYKNGVDAIAKEKGMSPEQVIASGDDALLTAQISSGIQSALERVGAGLVSKSIASRGGYKAMRDWLLKQGVNRNLARGASLLGVSGGEAITEYGQEGTAQIGEIAAKSPTARAFMDKLPKELFTPEATKRRAESLVGGLVGGFGLAGGGQAFQSAMDRTLFEAPKIGKASQRADMDIVQTDNKIQERNKIAQAMEEAVKGNPEAEGQIREQYQKRVNEAAPTDEEVLNAYEGLAALPETEEKNTIRENLEAYMAEKGIQPEAVGMDAGLGEGLRVTAPSEETMPPAPPIEPVAPEVTPTETAPLEEVPAEEVAPEEVAPATGMFEGIEGPTQETVPAPAEEVAPEVAPEVVPEQVVPAEQVTTESKKEEIEKKGKDLEKRYNALQKRHKKELADLNKKEGKNYVDVFDILNINEDSQDKSPRSKEAVVLAERHEKEFQELLQEQRSLQEMAEDVSYSNYDFSRKKSTLQKLKDAIGAVYRKDKDALEEGFMNSYEALDRANQVGGSNYVAHGMGKASISQAYNSLVELFTKGINPQRGGGKLYVAPLSGGISTGQTASGNAYMDGPFTLIANREHQGDITDISQVGGIIVNDGIATDEVISSLRDLFPNLVIESTSNTDKLVEQLNQKSEQQSAPVAQAEEVVAAAPAPKGKKKATPVTPAPAAPKKEQAPKPEPKKEGPKERKYPIEDKGKWYADEDYEKRGGKLVTMTPDEFLAQSKPLEIDEEARDNIDTLKEQIEKGGKLDPLAIYSTDKTKSSSTDGRHRAIAAKELGIKEVPVLDFTTAETKPSSTTPQEGTTVEIAPQREGGSPRKMVFKDGEWKQNVGGDIVKVGPSVQQQAQEMFGGKAEVKPAETKAEAKFNSKQESSASQEFDSIKKPSKIKTKSFDGKHGKGAFERMKNITDNFEDIMDGMSGKIKQDCL